MPEWWSYSPSDFLLFSPRAYYRLFELHNAALWPAHVVAVALGLAMLVAFRHGTPRTARTVALGLALLWAWVAYAFLWRRFLPINWAAIYAVIAFGIEGVLLAGFGASGKLRVRVAADGRSVVGVALFALAVVPYPSIAVIAGRPLAQAETFGLTPDPTAIATLGLLVLAEGRGRGVLLVIPVLWCLLSAATLWTMGSPDAWVPLAAAVLAVATALRGRTLVREAHPL